MNKWKENYTNWLKESVQELKDQGYKNSHIDFSDSANNTVEICEDGKVKFKDCFYLSGKLVTAWKDSPFHVE
ncbi:MAG: hypothetical protein GX813_05035 [Erysipelotrichia bacterium]|jgi:hypothetical protein|nr:hypothetical protein [Erysipelotrichia bacterium]